MPHSDNMQIFGLKKHAHREENDKNYAAFIYTKLFQLTEIYIQRSVAQCVKVNHLPLPSSLPAANDHQVPF